MGDLVSVVIPTRNRRQRLEQAIDSVRNQRYLSLEIIVVDDGSTDGTEEFLRSISAFEPRLRVVRNATPLGGGGARNAGVAASCGNYIAFLDDDDIFLPGKLEVQIRRLAGAPGSPAVSCSFLVRRRDSGEDAAVILRPPSDREELLRANILGGASVCIVLAESFRKVGGFDERLPSCQDWDLWLKLHALGPIMVCPEPLVRYSFHDEGQITGNRRAEYLGKRRVHLRYVKEMSSPTRLHSLCEVIFFRRVVFAPTLSRRFFGLFRLLLMARGSDRGRYVWRAVKLLTIKIKGICR
jgi:glycosyltransferase involved in cell wall biosynthesis